MHQESTPNMHRAMQQVKLRGKQVGVAINPATSLGTVDEVIESLDLLLLMTVNPGFGGQKFIESVLGKVRNARSLIDARNPRCELEVDGGVDLFSAPKAVAAGANVLVAGTCLFADPLGPAEAVRRLRAALPARPD
jgi:ribulose-phosphate 3-epimerase